MGSSLGGRMGQVEPELQCYQAHTCITMIHGRWSTSFSPECSIQCRVLHATTPAVPHACGSWCEIVCYSRGKRAAPSARTVRDIRRAAGGPRKGGPAQSSRRRQNSGTPLHTTFQQQTSYLGHQLACPRLELHRIDIRDGVRTDQVGKCGNPHQAGVGLCRLHKHLGNNRDRGEPLLLQGDTVVQTARRAPPSITHSGYHHVGVPMKLCHHFWPGWERS